MANYLQIDYKARYYQQGNLDAKTKYIFIAFHGYGQLAQYFMRHFTFLPEEYCVIVPEGLHRFYQEGMSGRVVASWMTKEDRLIDIENQSAYLNAILHDIKWHEYPKVKLIIFGFSQGVATACRWVVSNDLPIEKFYAWGGSLPIDLDPLIAQEYFTTLDFLSIYGEDDPFFPEIALKEQEEWRKKYAIESKKSFYTGGHKVIADHLKNLILTNE